MIKKVLLGLAALITASFGGVTAVQNFGTTSPEAMDISYGAGVLPADSQWITYGTFSGFKTKLDPTKIDDGANPQGQNTTVFDGDRVGIRNLGYDIYPSGSTASTTAAAIKSLHTFRKRDGSNILMRTTQGFIEYYSPIVGSWEVLKTGLTDGREFGFADFNVNTDLQSYVYFGNAVDSAMRWTGAVTMTNGAAIAAAGSVTVDSTTGFTATGSIIYCGQEIAYSALSATSFTVASAHACDDNRGVAQAVLVRASDPKGNIYLNANNRLFIAGVASSTQAVFFSQYGDATTFGSTLVTNGTATAAGIFNLGEGGGGVTAMVLDENSIYMFKRSIIYKATLSDSLYTVLPLKPFDGKSQTVGSINQKTTFTSGNSIYFITPDNQIMGLERVETVDYPQQVAISNIIKPTIDAAVFASSTGIVFRDKAYFSAKATSASSINDAIFVYNIRQKFWDSPIVGFNANDWAIFDDGTGEALYFGSASEPNVYKVNDTPEDYVYGVTANWRSKRFDFGTPAQLKELDAVWVEGYISSNTTISISLLLDEDGYTQTYATNFLGTESAYIYNSSVYNLFGLLPFGTERFGTNDDLSGKKKFRIYLNKNFKRIPFYNAQVEFASSGDNQAWEITNYGFAVRKSSQPEKSSLFRVFQ